MLLADEPDDHAIVDCYIPALHHSLSHVLLHLTDGPTDLYFASGLFLILNRVALGPLPCLASRLHPCSDPF